MKTAIHGNSGSNHERYVSPLGKQEMHDHYLKNLPAVWAFIRREVKDEIPVLAKNRFESNLIEYGRWVGAGKTGVVRLVGRSYTEFFEILGVHLHISWKYNPKVCDTCNDHLKVSAELNALLQQQKTQPNVDIRRSIEAKAAELHEYKIHEGEVKAQRGSISKS